MPSREDGGRFILSTVIMLFRLFRKVTIRPLNASAAADSASFYIRAIPPVGLGISSWGAIKKPFNP